MPRRPFPLARLLRALLVGAALVTLLVARRPAGIPSGAALRTAPPVDVAPALPVVRVALAVLLLGALVAGRQRRYAWR